VLYIDVAKVDRDVAHVVMAIHVLLLSYNIVHSKNFIRQTKREYKRHMYPHFIS
jgi:hypothetical protein